ncbi:MAG TPA: 3',5'-cyclic-AMP phosphodiesterase [Kangiella sp.]
MTYDCKRLFIGRPEMTVLHLSDPHLFADDQGSLLGVNTQESFCAVLDDIRTQAIDPDVIIVTGDISQDYSKASYQFFAEQMAKLGKPVFTLAGNHDEVGYLTSFLSQAPLFNHKQILTEHWQILMVSSHIEDQVHGHIDESELEWVRRCLEENSDLPTMLYMHHHPVPVGSDWLDEIGISNKDEILELVTEHPQVKLCGFGHVHQFSEYKIDNAVYCSVPSTCVQFKRHSADFAASGETPGYAVYQCHADGVIDKQHYRVDHYLPNVNFAISGY